MSLYSLTTIVPESFIICVINSSFMSHYVDDFVNNTQTFQINDARQLPVIIASNEELKEYELLFSQAIKLKKKQYLPEHFKNEIENELLIIQEKLDEMILKLYKLI
jgi:hypothetical protein